jgi:hypothetical protein
VTSTGDARAHTLARHRDILLEFTQVMLRQRGCVRLVRHADALAVVASLVFAQEFRRVRNNLVASREHAALLGAAARHAGSAVCAGGANSDSFWLRTKQRAGGPAMARNWSGEPRVAQLPELAAVRVPKRAALASTNLFAQGANTGREHEPAAARTGLHPQLCRAAG